MRLNTGYRELAMMYFIEMEIKKKKCRAEGCENYFTPYRTTDKYCSYVCANKSSKAKPQKRQRINPISKKRNRENSKYLTARKAFLLMPENKFCAVFPNKLATEIHHKKGRVGYADKTARENKIPLISDVRYFLAVSRDGHDKIENNPKWAYEKGYSIRRTN